MAVTTTDIQYNNSCLHDALNDGGYICSPDFTDKILTAINTKPVSGAFLYGMAGTGKSYLPMILAQVLERQLFVHQCTQGTREEDLLIKIMPSEDTTSGVKIGHGKIYEAAIESNNRPVMLMLDEWDKTRPSVDGFFLDFLQYGRLSLPGVEGGNIQANLDNLTIFITANDEREFHEALLRRFPMIHVDPIEPADVLSALKLTHDGNSYIPQMIDLYTRSISANLPKPATIQELRQLMDAIELLGSRADWNSLVYQYITKTPENHVLLSNQEKVENISTTKLKKIQADDYGVDNVPLRNEQNEPAMPDLRDLSKFNSSFKPVQYVPSDATLVLKRTSTNKNTNAERIKSLADNALMSQNLDGDDPNLASLPEWGAITDNYTFSTEVYTSVHVQYLDYTELFRRVNGEIKLVDKYVTRKEVNRMLRGKWLIHKRDDKEIIARLDGSEKIDLRFREGKGLEVICGTAASYCSLFRMNRKDNLATIFTIQESELGKEAIKNTICPKSSNKIAVTDLKNQVLNNTYTIGNSVLKSLSEHKGYCDAIWLQSPSGTSSCELRDVPFFDDLVNLSSSSRTISKVKVESIQDGFAIISKNMELICNNIEGYTLGMMKLNINGIVHPKILGHIIHWLPYLPLYRCFKHDGDIRTKLNKAGWSLTRNNSNTLSNGNVFAHVVYDYVIFCAFIEPDYYDESMLSLEIKQKINRIKSLEKKFKSTAS